AARRTLALLAALLLLALQAQAEPLPGNAEEAPDQEQSGEENQDVEISFAGVAASFLREAGLPRTPSCRCRRGGCSPFENAFGSCLPNSRPHTVCCQRRK
uniref:Mammalian defensins domain-containing protein n=1 Tax=Sciurus vulgaris TaxID=55149 RepID=A0A8D2B009_SCIVU